VTGLGAQGDEFHAQLWLGVQPVANAGVFQLAIVVPGQDVSVTLVGQLTHGDGSVFFSLHRVVAVEAALLLLWTLGLVLLRRTRCLVLPGSASLAAGFDDFVNEFAVVGAHGSAVFTLVLRLSSLKGRINPSMRRRRRCFEFGQPRT